MSDEIILASLRTQLFPLLKKDLAATDFCIDLMKVYQVWDDLIDKDTAYTDDDVNKVFHILLFTMPTNPFYNRYQAELRPLIMSSVLKWFDSNVMEEQAEGEDLHMAYMLRADIYSIYCHVAFLLGGLDYAKEVGVSIRRIYGEKMSEFIKEVSHA